jgi:hypothetical protein
VADQKEETERKTDDEEEGFLVIFKQVKEILEDTKTQTRRIVKPDEDGNFGDVVYQRINKHNEIGRPFLRVKWEVGRTYAVVPGRGQPAVWWRNDHWLIGYKPAWKPAAKKSHDELSAEGWQPLRIRITAIRRERLWEINEADAEAEGVEDRKAYSVLWDSINKRIGTRWQDNPEVWVLTFQVERENE